MRSISVLLGIGLFSAALLWPSTSTAQTCEGIAPFSRGPVRVGAGFSYTEPVNSYGGGLAVGSTRNGPYAFANGFAVEYDDIDEFGTGFSVGAGMPFRVSNSVEFCPLVGFYHETLNMDLDGDRLRLTSRAFSFGGSIGGVAASSASFELIPFAAAEFVASKGTASFLGESASENDSYLGVGVGGGFVLRRVVTIRPALSYAFGVEEADPIVSLMIGVNFGQAPSAQSRSERR